MTGAATAPSACLIVLDEGEGTNPLFVMPGAGGDARELAGLAARLQCPDPIIGVEVRCKEGRGGTSSPRVEDMAAAALSAIRALRPVGPIRLLGYSFGGLVALEIARQLAAEGEEVGRLGLIDAIYDPRHWPMRLFLRAQLRRTAVHVRSLAANLSVEALAEVVARAGRLSGRLRRRLGAGLPTGGAPSTSVQETCMAAMGAYTPCRYESELTLFRSAAEQDFGCDPADLWRPLIKRLDVVPVAGAHLALVRDPAALDSLASAVDSWLLPAGSAGRTGVQSPPSALVVTTVNWHSTARLALGLSDAGFVVSAICPVGHPLRRADFLRRVWRSRIVAPRAALRAAIGAVSPDLIIPCDDRAVAQLLDLHAAEVGDDAVSAGLRAAIERSLAAREHYAILQARTPIAGVAVSEGASVAETVVVEGTDDLVRCAAAWGFPLVLKSDGSWGGLGVRIVRNMDEAAGALRQLGGAASLALGVRRLIRDRDAGFLASALRRKRAAVSAQRFVRGVPANVAAACWQGRVLAAVGVEAVRTAGDRGPATVVRRVESLEMTAAVAKLAARLGLSGLCGFDFMRDDADGHYYLIEMNARATPTCHLEGGDGVGLFAALRAAVSGETPPLGEKTAPGDVIALFPQEMLRDPESPYLATARHDVPSRSEFLIRAGQAAVARRRRMDMLARHMPSRAWAAGRRASRKTSRGSTEAPA